MKVIAGKEGSGNGKAVMGRIVFPYDERYDTVKMGEALIPIVYDLNSEILEDTCVVGAVLISSKNETSLQFDTSFPFLVVERGNEKTLKEISGKLAYLDAQSRLLISTPDIDTVNKYENQKRREEDIKYRLPVISTKMPLLSCDIKNITDTEGARGILVDMDKIGLKDEDAVFNFLTKICDTSPTKPLSVKLSYSNSKEEVEKNGAMIRGIYRASVYGNISIMCAGFSHIEEIEEYGKLLSESFCRLEESGREINGFMERGIVCDSYVILFSLLSKRVSKGVGKGSRILDGVDFICFDMDKLSEKWLIKEKGRFLTSPIWGIKYIIDNFPKYKLIVKKAETARLLRALSVENGWENILPPCEIYVLPKSIDSVKSAVSMWGEKNTDRE